MAFFRALPFFRVCPRRVDGLQRCGFLGEGTVGWDMRGRHMYSDSLLACGALCGRTIGNLVVYHEIQVED
jgi:hypothetical protein